MQIPSILNTPRSELPFPEVIDNSMRSKFTQCEGAFAYSYIENLSPTGTSVHLHAGGAFAHGVEHVRRAFYVEQRSKEEALAIGVTELLRYYGDFVAPPESPKSAERMAGALVFYFDTHDPERDYVKPWTDDENHGIEFSFAVPLPVAHPQTGMPILYSGRFDMLGQHRDGPLFVVDEKTASSLGGQWSRQWELDSQFTGYCFGAREFGKDVAGAVIRGVSILKTKYDCAEAIVYRSQWTIDRWKRQLTRDVERMIEVWEAVRTGRMEDINWKLDKSACGSYGGCSFSMLCSSNAPDRWKPINFEPRVWHPMLREEREDELKALKNGEEK